MPLIEVGPGGYKLLPRCIVGPNRNTHRDWMKQSKAFEKAFWDADGRLHDGLLEESDRRIYEGHAVPMMHQGQPTFREVQLDDEPHPRLVQNFIIEKNDRLLMWATDRQDRLKKERLERELELQKERRRPKLKGSMASGLSITC